MRAVVLFVVALLLGACLACSPAPALVVAQPAPAPFPAQAAELAAKSVAFVELTDAGVRVFCTGVWVSANTILTADHCVDDIEQEAFVYTVANASALHFAHVVAHDEDHDLAVLVSLDAPAHPWATVGEENIAPGDVCQAMGHPLGLTYSYSQGFIAAVRDASSDFVRFRWIQATVPISPGSSGGGLFDAGGRLIGITSATATRGQNVNVFVHRDAIVALLARTATVR